MIKILMYYMDFETRNKLPPEGEEFDDEDEVDMFSLESFLARVGVRSARPFSRHGKKVLLTHIVEEFTDGSAKTIFVNSHKI